MIKNRLQIFKFWRNGHIYGLVHICIIIWSLQHKTSWQREPLPIFSVQIDFSYYLRSLCGDLNADLNVIINVYLEGGRNYSTPSDVEELKSFGAKHYMTRLNTLFCRWCLNNLKSHRKSIDILIYILIPLTHTFWGEIKPT